MKRVIKIFTLIIASGTAAMLLFGANGSAYIDPSVMTYLIQAVAGIVIAVGAAAGIYLRKARRKFNEKFNIDENRNKEVESDDIIVRKKGES